MPAIIEIALSTARLLKQHWIALIAIFCTVTFVADRVLKYAIKLQVHDHHVPALAVFTGSVSIEIAGLVAMIRLLLKGAKGNENPKGKTQEASGSGEFDLPQAVAVSIVPLMLFYGMAGLTNKRYGEFVYEVIGNTGSGVQFSAAKFLVAAAAAFVCRYFISIIWQKTRLAPFAFAGALIEPFWMILTLFAVRPTVNSGISWIVGRQFFDWFTWPFEQVVRFSFNALRSIDLIDINVGWVITTGLPGFEPEIRNAIAVPFFMLVISFLIVDPRIAELDAPIQNQLQRRSPGGVAKGLVLGFVKRWISLARGTRLAISSGLSTFLAACLLWNLALMGGDLLQRLIIRALGAHPEQWWVAWDSVIVLPSEMVNGIVPLAVIAATVLTTARSGGDLKAGNRNSSQKVSAELAAPGHADLD